MLSEDRSYGSEDRSYGQVILAQLHAHLGVLMYGDYLVTRVLSIYINWKY